MFAIAILNALLLLISVAICSSSQIGPIPFLLAALEVLEIHLLLELRLISFGVLLVPGHWLLVAVGMRNLTPTSWFVIRSANPQLLLHRLSSVVGTPGFEPSSLRWHR
jgi:hypothetical protein